LLTGSNSDDYLRHSSQMSFNRSRPTCSDAHLLDANRIPSTDQGDQNRTVMPTWLRAKPSRS
jgi:hypothetical protein